MSFDAWHPGIESSIPEELRALSTTLRPENVSTGMAAARELRDLTGLDYADLVAFRPSRLALHELLIRVNANISVPDGEAIGDLGINFRRLVSTIHARCIEPRRDEIEATYGVTRKRALECAKGEVEAAFSGKRAPQPSGALEAAVHRAVARVVGAVTVRHGQPWGPRDVLATLSADLACNEAASDAIGALIEPWLLEAAVKEGYKVLPRQERPLVMNTKGPSASGKSTLRPLQKHLAPEIGVDWSDFSLISPDIWRKQLLDYDSLGEHYKYAGPFTGEELRIVDLKLDRYMAAKAARGGMSHLLIDRFRFDSFAPDSDEAGSNLLTRFGSTVYLFFMITPPGSLVERAWARGLEFGRYKAVDDTLAHGVEAYSGMPDIFFTWVRRADKRVHFEFLDNSVPQGERPRTVAFGWNDVLYVVDEAGLIDIERFRRVNIGAHRPSELWPDAGVLAAERNTAFLDRCRAEFRDVRFIDPGEIPVPERRHNLGA